MENSNTLDNLGQTLMETNNNRLRKSIVSKKPRKESDGGKLTGLENLLKDFKDNFNKCRYRKCLEDLQEKEAIFNHYLGHWKVSETRIKCMLKIINKKFHKYSGNMIKGLDTWLQRTDEEILNLMDYLEDDFTNTPCLLESCIKFSLEQCYNWALKSRNEHHMADAAGYLAMGGRLIRFSSEFTLDPESLYISQKVFIFISSLMIGDSNYEIAKEYLNTALRFAFRELELKFDSDGEVNLINLPKNDSEEVEKIVLNIVTAFYQIGVCEENLGNIIKAIEAYKEAKWFSINFLKKNMPELSQFICDVNMRAMNYFTLIQNIKIHGTDFREQILTEKTLKAPKVYFDEMEGINKFANAKKVAESMKYEEIEEDTRNKSEKMKHILSTVTMVNHLMSDKFKDIIYNMDKIKINTFDKDTREKIQKKVNEIKLENIYLEKENLRKSKLKTIANNKETKNADLSLDTRGNIITTASYQSSTNRNTVSTFRSKVNANNKSGFKSKPQSARVTSQEKNEIPKFNYSKYVFDETYKNKVGILNKMMDKEIKFQKRLLNLKKCEKIHIDDFDELKVAESCKAFFKKELKNKTKVMIEDDSVNKKKEILNVEKIKNEKMKDKLETEVLQSLDIKAFIKYEEFNKKLKHSKYNIKKDTIVDSSSVNQKNNTYLTYLESKLHNLKFCEDTLKKDLRPRSQMKRATIHKPLFNIKDNIDDFLITED